MPKKILIVEDNELQRSIQAAAFKEGGFEVAFAVDGQDAWEVLGKGSKPDIVFSGILMPRMGGFELIQMMKTNPAFSSIPVVVVSHRGLPEDQKKAGEMHVADFILQTITTPEDMVKRAKIILGEIRKFRVTVATDQLDGRLLANYLEQRSRVFTSFGKEAVLDVTEEQDGRFKIEIAPQG